MPVIFDSVEFYVIAVTVAAAVIGLAARPAPRGEARTWLLPADLSPQQEGSAVPAIIITSNDRCDITIRRTGLPPGVESMMLSATLTGRDISIEESIVRSQQCGTRGEDSAEAEATLGFTGPERYHISYSSPALSLFAAVQFTVRPGIRIYKELTLS